MSASQAEESGSIPVTRSYLLKGNPANPGIPFFLPSRPLDPHRGSEDPCRIRYFQTASAAVSGPVSPDAPASILRLHPDVVLVGDKAALSELPRGVWQW